MQNACISKLLCLLLVISASKSINILWNQVLQSAFTDIDAANISTTVSQEDIEEAYIDEFGVMYSSDKKRLLSCSTQKKRKGNLTWTKGVLFGSYEVKQGTVCICDYAFFNCRQLVSVKIPSSVKCIGNYAFAECWELSSLDLCEGLNRIGFEALRNCIRLHSLIVPSSLKSIDYKAFEGSNITSLLIKNGEKLSFSSMFPDYNDIVDELPF